MRGDVVTVLGPVQQLQLQIDVTWCYTNLKLNIFQIYSGTNSHVGHTWS